MIDVRDAGRDVSAGYDIDEDNQVAALLSEVFDETTTFNELRLLLEGIRKRTAAGTSLDEIDPRTVLREDSIAAQPFTAGDAAHGPAILRKIPLYLEDSGLPELPGGIALEDGAGLGYFIDGFSKHFEQLFVVDLSMAYLMLARKILDERHLANVTLVCASVEHLPFRNEAFDFVHSNNVIEHVANQGRLVSEAHRVLNPTGLLFIMSPNRFSVYFEPHFLLPGFGFWPKAIRRALVRRYRRQDIDDVGLRSLGEVRALAAASFGENVKAAFIPRRLEETATGGTLRNLLTGALRSPLVGGAVNLLVNKAALGVMPYHVLLCTKQDAARQR